SEYLYKTGDQVRYRPDGAIEYLGRIDQQVKIRGFRIELGEISTALEAHSSIDQAVITVSGNSVEQKRLIAYLTFSLDKRPSTLELREHLLALIPDYMVPAKFVWLRDLPLTPNGKIDKRALPEPDWQLEADQDQQQPNTDVEQTLVDIWTALLPAEIVDVHDNFFELGGDSILAMQIVSRAQQAGISLSPQRLFQYQTIAEL
ncbi:MAG: phosphopantetheine-binding protein, partial [Cyanobacteria bacterium J06560_6]